MPLWWKKSLSKKAKKKSNKESFIDTIHRKFKCVSEVKFSCNARASRRDCSETVSEKEGESNVDFQSPSPSSQVARSQSFADIPQAQSLPLPAVQCLNIHCTRSESNVLARPGIQRDPKQSTLPLPRPSGYVPNQSVPAGAEVEFALASLCSDRSIDIDDPFESCLMSPQTSDYENGYRTAMNSPLSVKQKDQSPGANIKQYQREKLRPANILLNTQTVPSSPKWGPLSSHLPNLQMPHPGDFYSAPDSSMSSPSRSPLRTFGHGLSTSGMWAGKPYANTTVLGPEHCSTPGSGHNFCHSSVGGDMLGPVFWQHSGCSPECSPLPSPRITCPGPGSRIHSGAVTPVHPRAGGLPSQLLTKIYEDRMQPSHRLPHPPIISNSSFSTSYSTGTTPAVPKSPGRIDSFPGPGSCWKKGRLLGRGTCGHVYLGFNCENGDMCAMKEVALFSDDPKSKESAQQLGQEISLLSRLRHHNIVQYYGSETIDDKLCIYLEYVSGGSVNKLLQDYGQLGEAAIRSYTQQILSGLAYLHSKNTVHRDIKGANILVDPNGRVKLADFGMAKHITGKSCPLSFNGSPYWMAPEVINSSIDCNLAVDIWSLGCTVLEMATSKPPWSQYERVAAMFKIGNSKELPAIPDHLSDEGKLFVRKCLQRDPLNRPTAAQLLEHPFVRNTVPWERPILCSESLESTPANSVMRSLGVGHARKTSEGKAINHSGCPKTGSKLSEAHIPKSILCSVSPIGSPLSHSRLSHHMSGRLSPSPISSPQATSGSSTINDGCSTSLFHHPRQPTNYLPEGISPIPGSTNNFYPPIKTQPNIFHGSSQASHLLGDVFSSENVFHVGHFGQFLQGSPREIYDGHCVS